MSFKLKEKAAGAAAEDVVTPEGAADGADAVAVMAAGAAAVGVDPVFAVGSVQFGFAHSK